MKGQRMTGVRAAGMEAAGMEAAGGIAQARLLSTHAPYYWRWLKSLPYGVTRRITRRRCLGYPAMEPFFTDQYGLEMGGPSPIFRGNRLIPVYDRCRAIDNCNFAIRTIWDVPGNAPGPSPEKSPEKSPEPGFSFARQYVAEASDLCQMRDATYDFVLASHVLEHVANPLRALQEWRRVLRPGGTMLVIVPDQRATFDRLRAPTSLEHIVEDFQNNTTEDDLTHLDEILALHDLALDPDAGSGLQFRERCLNNTAVRALHHHVFVPEVLVRVFSRMRMRVLSVAIERPFHIVAFAQKEDAIEREEAGRQNLGFLGESADWKRHDPLRKAAHMVAAELKTKLPGR